MTLEQIQALARAYDDKLNELELPPNGDDYNALLAIIMSGVTTLPKKEGR